MTFVSGGYTQAHFNGTAFVNNFFPHIGVPDGLFRDAATYHGWFIGGGEEYAFTWLPFPGLFWKTEYRLSEFDTDRVVTRFIEPGINTPAFATDSRSGSRPSRPRWSGASTSSARGTDLIFSLT